MTQCFFRGRLCVALLAVAASLFLVHSAPADPKAGEPDGEIAQFGKQDRQIAGFVCEILKEGHLNRPEIDEKVSRRFFDHFLKELDPTKVYFLKEDVDEFKKSEADLGKQLQAGNLDFAHAVFERFLQRAKQRQELIKKLVNADQNYEADEELDTNYDALPWGNEEQVRERWRKRIKFDLLMQRLGEKPAPAGETKKNEDDPKKKEEEARKKVLSRYQNVLKRYEQFDNADRLEIYLTALTTSIDPHSTYMSPNTLEDFAISMRLNLDGIGAILRSENGQTVVVEVVPGGAAAKDGHLKPNDKIIAVAQGDDGTFVDAVDMKLQDVVKMIRGERGTKVQLKVIPVGKIEPAVYKLTRQKIELKSQEARGDVVDVQGKKAGDKSYKIGVIDLPSFYADPGLGRPGKGDAKSATEDVRRLLDKFVSKDHVDGVILDLRHNGGGSLNEAISLTGLFIKGGPVVQVKNAQGSVKHRDAPAKAEPAYGGPLIVLASRLSASASEILAGALQDYGRALIVGDNSTYGKGTVQLVIDLGEQVGGSPPPKLGALKLTIQQFYRPDGDSTQVEGVHSDVVLPSLAEYLAGGEQEQDTKLPFDKVDPVDHKKLGRVTQALKDELNSLSKARRADSKDFRRLNEDVTLFKERKANKKMPLNEKKLKAQLSRDEAEKIDQKVNEASPPETPSSEAYKFRKNYYNDEVLQIMRDFIENSKKETASR